MKKILVLICFPVTVFAQSKKDNTIIIHGSVPYQMINKTLFQNGYSVVSNDTNYISTSSKELSNAPIALKFMIEKTDSVIYIKGMCKLTIELSFLDAKSASDFDQVSYIGEKGGAYKKGFKEMDRIARLLSQNITYSKQ